MYFGTEQTSAVSPRTYQFSITATNNLGYTSPHSEVTAPIVIDYGGPGPLLVSNPYGSGTRRALLQDEAPAPAPEPEVEELFIGPDPLLASLRFGAGEELQALFAELLEVAPEGALQSRAASAETPTSLDASVPMIDLDASVPVIDLDAVQCDVDIEALSLYDPQCGPDAITYPTVAAATCAGHSLGDLLGGDCDFQGFDPFDTFDCTCPFILDEVCLPEPTYFYDGELIAEATTYPNARCALCDGVRPDRLLPGPCPSGPVEDAPIDEAPEPSLDD